VPIFNVNEQPALGAAPADDAVAATVASAVSASEAAAHLTFVDLVTLTPSF
jgi:hypothetical protein